jgi:hypothetical protein
MSASTEEPREQVEWVVAAAGRLALAVLLYPVVSVLVVYFAQRAGRENVVGFRYFDEFLARRIIATRWVSNCLAGVMWTMCGAR